MSMHLLFLIGETLVIRLYKKLKMAKICRFCYNTTQESEVRLWQLSIRKNN